MNTRHQSAQLQQMPAVVEMPHLTDQEKAWPIDARAALFVLECGATASDDGELQRRSMARGACRVQAVLCDPNEPLKLGEELLYLRDFHQHAVGFLSSRPLRLALRGTLHVDKGDGEAMRISCVVQRCREFMEGWYEGVLVFEQELPQLRVA